MGTNSSKPSSKLSAPATSDNETIETITTSGAAAAAQPSMLAIFGSSAAASDNSLSVTSHTAAAKAQPLAMLTINGFPLTHDGKILGDFPFPELETLFLALLRQTKLPGNLMAVATTDNSAKPPSGLPERLKIAVENLSMLAEKKLKRGQISPELATLLQNFYQAIAAQLKTFNFTSDTSLDFIPRHHPELAELFPRVTENYWTRDLKRPGIKSYYFRKTTGRTALFDDPELQSLVSLLFDRYALLESITAKKSSYEQDEYTKLTPRGFDIIINPLEEILNSNMRYEWLRDGILKSGGSHAIFNLYTPIDIDHIKKVLDTSANRLTLLTAFHNDQLLLNAIRDFLIQLMQINQILQNKRSSLEENPSANPDEIDALRQDQAYLTEIFGEFLAVATPENYQYLPQSLQFSPYERFQCELLALLEQLKTDAAKACAGIPDKKIKMLVKSEIDEILAGVMQIIDEANIMPDAHEAYIFLSRKLYDFLQRQWLTTERVAKDMPRAPGSELPSRQMDQLSLQVWLRFYAPLVALVTSSKNLHAHLQPTLFGPTKRADALYTEVLGSYARSCKTPEATQAFKSGSGPANAGNVVWSMPNAAWYYENCEALVNPPGADQSFRLLPVLKSIFSSVSPAPTAALPAPAAAHHLAAAAIDGPATAAPAAASAAIIDGPAKAAPAAASAAASQPTTGKLATALETAAPAELPASTAASHPATAAIINGPATTAVASAADSQPAAAAVTDGPGPATAPKTVELSADTHQPDAAATADGSKKTAETLLTSATPTASTGAATIEESAAAADSSDDKSAEPMEIEGATGQSASPPSAAKAIATQRERDGLHERREIKHPTPLGNSEPGSAPAMHANL